MTLCDRMDCGPPGSSVHVIFQTGILEQVAFPSPGGLPNPGIEPTFLVSPPLAGRFFTTMPPGKPFFLPLLQALRLSRLLPTLLGFIPSETCIQYS